VIGQNGLEKGLANLWSRKKINVSCTPQQTTPKPCQCHNRLTRNPDQAGHDTRKIQKILK
jgi:hypothetical protein